MTEKDELFLLFHREGAYELCAALLDAQRTRQTLIELTDVPTRSLDRRIAEARELSLIEFVPTVKSERVVALQPDTLPEPFHRRCTALLKYHRATTQNGRRGDASFRPLHRDNLNEPQHHDAPLKHMNSFSGRSRFKRRR